MTKDRILELVQQGVISTEEGIELLEKLGESSETSTDAPSATEVEEEIESEEIHVEPGFDWEDTKAKLKEAFDKVAAEAKPYLEDVAEVGKDLKVSLTKVANKHFDFEEKTIKVPKKK
jgi:DUF4097 and DUF4098 domain-containing protein YvlB